MNVTCLPADPQVTSSMRFKEVDSSGTLRIWSQQWSPMTTQLSRRRSPTHLCLRWRPPLRNRSC